MAAELVPTGIADEEDAGRYLSLRLNPDLLFCPNCETHYERDKVDCSHTGSALRDGDWELKYFCPRCDYRLYEKNQVRVWSTNQKLTK